MNLLSVFGTGALLTMLLLPGKSTAAIDSFDSLVVRQILDSAGWQSVPVDSVIPLQTIPINTAGIVRVSTLNLTYRPGLAPAPITRLPDEIGQLPELVSLSLSGNLLSDVPASLATLYKLDRLDLSWNRLIRLPETLKGTAIRNLVVNHNQLDSLPGWIDSISRLQTLSMVANRLTTLPARVAKLAGLSTLMVDSNQIESLPAELTLLTTLRVGVGGNRLCSIGDTLARWLDKYYLSSDWRATQRCSMDIAAVVTDAVTGTVVNVANSTVKVQSDCRPVQLLAVAVGTVVRPDRQEVLKAVEVRFEECFETTNNYFMVTIPWGDVPASPGYSGLLSVYFVQGNGAEYLGGTVDMVKQTISVRSNRAGTYLLTSTSQSVQTKRVVVPRRVVAAPRIVPHGDVFEVSVTQERSSTINVRLLSLDGKVLMSTVQPISAGATTLRIGAKFRSQSVIVVELIGDGFHYRTVVQPL